MKINKQGKEEAYFNFGKFFLGIFLALFGLVFLANNLNVFALNVDLGVLWPIFIIFIGLLFFSREDQISVVVGIIVSVIAIVIVYFSLFNPVSGRDDIMVTDFPVIVNKGNDVEKVNITLNAGAGELNVAGLQLADKLIVGNLMTNIMELKTESKMSGVIQNVELNLEGKRRWFNGDIKNELNLGLNKDVPTVFYLNSGASDNNVDLSEIKAERVEIHTGASNLNLKLGGKVPMSVVDIEAGASSINISLPKDAGVMLTIDSGMASKQLDGFTDIDKNTYQLSNYGSADKKINISVKMGMASLKVNWYDVNNSLSTVKLYYYKQSDDKDNTCGNDFVLPVERQIPVSDDIIGDSIRLLIKGQLTAEEKAAGFASDFPADFNLLTSDLGDGVLKLNFTDVPGLMAGGTCKGNLMLEEIIKTARQFPEVKKIVIYPDSLF